MEKPFRGVGKPGDYAELERLARVVGGTVIAKHAMPTARLAELQIGAHAGKQIALADTGDNLVKVIVRANLADSAAFRGVGLNSADGLMLAGRLAVSLAGTGTTAYPIEGRSGIEAVLFVRNYCREHAEAPALKDAIAEMTRLADTVVSHLCRNRADALDGIERALRQFDVAKFETELDSQPVVVPTFDKTIRDAMMAKLRPG